ncbi:MAG: hypothetical protein KAT71_07845, partial [Gammaproteobacteria bacterium]|nr:hypothetical protein [Gammaproteobacteria bacterium]
MPEQKKYSVSIGGVGFVLSREESYRFIKIDYFRLRMIDNHNKDDVDFLIRRFFIPTLYSYDNDLTSQKVYIKWLQTFERLEYYLTTLLNRLSEFNPNNQSIFDLYLYICEIVSRHNSLSETNNIPPRYLDRLLEAENGLVLLIKIGGLELDIKSSERAARLLWQDRQRHDYPQQIYQFIVIIGAPACVCYVENNSKNLQRKHQKITKNEEVNDFGRSIQDFLAKFDVWLKWIILGRELAALEEQDKRNIVIDLRKVLEFLLSYHTRWQELSKNPRVQVSYKTHAPQRVELINLIGQFYAEIYFLSKQPDDFNKYINYSVDAVRGWQFLNLEFTCYEALKEVFKNISELLPQEKSDYFYNKIIPGLIKYCIQLAIFISTYSNYKGHILTKIAGGFNEQFTVQECALLCSSFNQNDFDIFPMLREVVGKIWSSDKSILLAPAESPQAISSEKGKKKKRRKKRLKPAESQKLQEISAPKAEAATADKSKKKRLQTKSVSPPPRAKKKPRQTSYKKIADQLRSAPAPVATKVESSKKAVTKKEIELPKYDIAAYCSYAVQIAREIQQRCNCAVFPTGGLASSLIAGLPVTTVNDIDLKVAISKEEILAWFPQAQQSKNRPDLFRIYGPNVWSVDVTCCGRNFDPHKQVSGCTITNLLLDIDGSWVNFNEKIHTDLKHKRVDLRGEYSEKIF